MNDRQKFIDTADFHQFGSLHKDNANDIEDYDVVSDLFSLSWLQSRMFKLKHYDNQIFSGIKVENLFLLSINKKAKSKAVTNHSTFFPKG